MLKTSCFIKKLNEKVYCTCRRVLSTNANETQSFRQRAWAAAQERYINYEHVQYSSYLELDVNKLLPSDSTVFPPLSSLRDLVKPLETKNVFACPQNWMDDYEFYAGDSDTTGNINARHGTPDPSVPPSKVPCSGCGADLHCSSTSMPGYIPSEIFKVL